MYKLLKVISVLLMAVFFAVSAHAEDGGGVYYDFGVFAYEDGDYDGAEENLKMALKANPDNPYYNHFMGKIYFKVERFEDSMRYLEKAWEIDSNMSDLKYDIAYLHYKMKDYSRAAELFSEVVAEEPANVLAYYNGGVSLYKEKRYDEALGNFLKASEMSPTIMDNGYYYAGICYYNLEEFDRATEKLEYVKDNAAKETLREYAAKWLDAVESGKKASKPYSLYMKMSYGYDDNVRLEAIGKDVYDDEEDYVTFGYFSGRYNFINQKDHKAGAGYTYYQTWHDDIDGYDMKGSIFEVFTKHRFGSVTGSLSYIPHYYWLDSASYQMKHQFKPEVTVELNKNLLGRLSYSYYRNNYMQDNERDGHTNDLSMNMYYNFPNSKIMVFGGGGVEYNASAHDDYSYDMMKMNVGLSSSIFKGFTLNMRGTYSGKDYGDIHSFYLIEREDSKYKGSVSLSHRLLYDWMGISGEFNYTKNNSSINDYQYERKVTTLSLTARF